jgi:glycosyltransferase involved in cell wall biosynthesis
MRILCEALGFGEGDNFGGSVRVARGNARALAARGHHVTFVCTNRMDKRTPLFPETTERVTPEGIRVVYLRTTTMPLWPGAVGPHFVHGAGAWLAREVPSHDVVHLYENRSHLAAATAAAARVAGVPYLLHPQGALRPGDQSRLIKRIYDRWIGGPLVAGAARVIAGNRAELAQLREAGATPEQALVVPSGVDLARFDALPERGRFRTRHGIAPDAPMILCVGRLEYNKGQDILLEAFCTLGHPDAVLVFVGPDYGLEFQLRQTAAGAGRAATVVFTGPITGDREVLETFVDADVFVQPSRNEQFGMAILEACAVSRPMVLTEGCQIADAFRDEAALVVPCDSGAMAAALGRLLGDHDLRVRFGAAARAILERNYTLPAVAAQLEAVYAAVIAENVLPGSEELSR